MRTIQLTTNANKANAGLRRWFTGTVFIGAIAVLRTRVEDGIGLSRARDVVGRYLMVNRW
ncbi:MAG: hypothetical protein NVS2B7_41050 [Herpetosiphon sp.]